MQGRPNQGNEAWNRERSTAARLAALKAISQGTGQHRPISQGTGKYRPISTSTGEHRAIPQPPPNRRHLDSRPELPRVPRPERQPTQFKRMRPLFIVMGASVAIIAIIAFVVVFSLVNALNQAAGPNATTADFVSSLSTQNYENAYHDLGPAIKIRINLQEFTQQAQALDQRYGVITSAPEVDGSATVNNNTESFTYTITRAKMTKPYKLTITLQQDPNDNNSWKIVNYGPTLGPTQS